MAWGSSETDLPLLYFYFRHENQKILAKEGDRERPYLRMDSSGYSLTEKINKASPGTPLELQKARNKT